MVSFGVQRLKSEGKIQDESVNETSKELVPYFTNYKPISEIEDSKSSTNSLQIVWSTESGKTKSSIPSIPAYYIL